MAILSTVLTQTDKIAVSKMLPLDMLGYYSLATAVASVPLMLASPIASAIFPRMTGLVAAADRSNLTPLYHQTCQLVAVVTLPAGLAIALFSSELVLAWTGSATTAGQVATTASLLVCGQMLQAITVMPFYVALAHGNVSLNLRVGVFSVILITPLLIFLIRDYGVVGGGISWLIMNLCTLPPYMYYLHKRFLPGELETWARRDVVYPMLISTPVILIARLLLPVPCGRILTVAIISCACLISILGGALSAPSLRGTILKYAGIRSGASYAK
jgi:O-antigen/teichoic acid export membrane protein